MSRVSVSNCLKQFRERGLIQQSYGRIRVMDRPGLRSLFGERDFY